jgi:hypothetical protein
MISTAPTPRGNEAWGNTTLGRSIGWGADSTQLASNLLLTHARLHDRRALQTCATDVRYRRALHRHPPRRNMLDASISGGVDRDVDSCQHLRSRLAWVNVCVVVEHT